MDKLGDGSCCVTSAQGFSENGALFSFKRRGGGTLYYKIDILTLSRKAEK